LRRPPLVARDLAKEEYATTWQEEEQGEPQEERPRPEIHRRPQRKALDTLARTRVPQDECTKEHGSKGSGSKGSGQTGSGQTQHQAQRREPQGFADPPPRSSSCGSSRRE
jgi:hypothetical protein